MSWQSILKYGSGRDDIFQQNKVERLAEVIAELLDENIEVVTRNGINYNLNNANDIIEMAKNGLTKDYYDTQVFQANKYRKFDLTAPNNLRLFLSTMKQKGYDMDMFNVKGLLTQSSSEDLQQIDYTNQIKQTIQMLTRMNKPITKESIMYEIDMEETEWNDKYNKLLQERQL